MNDDHGSNDDVDRMLARAGLPLTEEEHARLRRLYPLVRDKAERLRRLDLAYTEPAVTYRLPAEPDPARQSDPRSD